MQRGFDRVFGAAIGVAGRGDLKLVTGQEMYGETADFLVGVVRDWDLFGVLAFLGVNFFNPVEILRSIGKPRKLIGKVTHATSSRSPIDTYRHSWFPFRRSYVATPSSSALIGPNNVEARAAIDAEVVDGPVGVVDRLKGAGLDVLNQYGASQAKDHTDQ